MERFIVEELNFVKCEATNTRLMGVVGVHSIWKNSEDDFLHVLFHLDFENYGIDGYTVISDNKKYIVDQEVKRMMGGLGGSMVDIKECELKVLLNSAYSLNIKYGENLPNDTDGWISWFLILNADAKSCKEPLYNKICEEVNSEIQLINYAIMRLIGLDKSGFTRLITSSIKYNDWVKEPSMLLKNTSEIIMKDSKLTSYRVTSLIHTQGKYMLFHWIVSVIFDEKLSEYRLCGFDLTDQMTITGHEAALMLRRNEFVQVFEINKTKKWLDYFEFSKPELMENGHENGRLYTAFRDHNNHVLDDNYFLNGDIFAVYYITNNNELIVSSFDKKCFEKSILEIQNARIVEAITKSEYYEFNQSLIYEFVHSNESKFNDFLEKLMQ